MAIGHHHLFHRVMVDIEKIAVLQHDDRNTGLGVMGHPGDEAINISAVPDARPQVRVRNEQPVLSV